jgi:hypothetical protein
MFSSQYRRTLALTLVLSAGTASLSRAEAAPGRSGSAKGGPAASAIQVDLIPRTFIEAVKNLLAKLEDAPQKRHSRPGHDPGRDEGPSVCPHGGHPPHP